MVAADAAPTGSGIAALGGGLAGSRPGAAAAEAPVRRERSDDIGIGPDEVLHDVQTAYGREDVAALWNERRRWAAERPPAVAASLAQTARTPSIRR